MDVCRVLISGNELYYNNGRVDSFKYVLIGENHYVCFTVHVVKHLKKKRKPLAAEVSRTKSDKQDEDGRRELFLFLFFNNQS